LFSVFAPFQASQVEFRVWNPFSTVFASSSNIVLEELDREAAGRTFYLKYIFRFPMACILTGTFHAQTVPFLHPIFKALNGIFGILFFV